MGNKNIVRETRGKFYLGLAFTSIGWEIFLDLRRNFSTARLQASKNNLKRYLLQGSSKFYENWVQH